MIERCQTGLKLYVVQEALRFEPCLPYNAILRIWTYYAPWSLGWYCCTPLWNMESTVRDVLFFFSGQVSEVSPLIDLTLKGATNINAKQLLSVFYKISVQWSPELCAFHIKEAGSLILLVSVSSSGNDTDIVLFSAEAEGTTSIPRATTSKYN